MSSVTSGLHHLTAIATRPQGNIEFYVRLLGLRLVKRTVNYDDPQTYHFYFGDALGRPGTIASFFAWPGAGPAVRGTDEPTAMAFRVPPGALPAWSSRLRFHQLESSTMQRFGQDVIVFADPDGIPLELTEAPLKGSTPDNWPGAPVPGAIAVQGLHSATVTTSTLDQTAALLEELGLARAHQQEGDRLRLTVGEGAGATHVDLLHCSEAQPGRLGAGSLHHLALRVPDEQALGAARQLLEERGLRPTAVKNRHYFKSVYFKEPGGAIFELATDGPGFAVDEDPSELGMTFRLPQWLETEREFLRGRLPVTASPEYADRFGGS
jgi:glyoxalase family protein